MDGIYDLEEKHYWISLLINDEAVCKTAPATPGLLNIWYGAFVVYPNKVFTNLQKLSCKKLCWEKAR